MTILAAVLEPGEPLAFRSMIWPNVEVLVGGFYGATASVRLPAGPGPVKLLAPDVGLLSPELYPRQEAAVTGFLAALGGSVQPWGGTLAVYAVDSWEGGFPVSLEEEQVAYLTEVYTRTTGRSPARAT